MDDHLSALETSLSALADLQKRGTLRTRRTQPFTDAVLNKRNLDVLDFIRDADHFEANLFWYPPRAAASAQVASSSKLTATAAVSDALQEEGASAAARVQPGAPKVPEARRFEPPTPLRRGAGIARGADASMQTDYDARTLLKAAQKLMDNYHNAPRARKHVKGLLRRNAETQKAIQHSENALSETSELIALLSSPTEGKALVARLRREQLSPSSPRRTGHDLVEEKKRLTAEIRREEMEIMAIEQTLEELLSQKQAAKVDQDGSASAVIQHAGEIVALPSQAQGEMGQENDADTETTHRFAEADETVRLRREDRPAAIDSASEKWTEQSNMPTSSPAQASDPASEQAQHKMQSSDELERICENIWLLFGNHLRFVMPDRDGGNLEETLHALQNLSVGGSGPISKPDLHDVSMASGNNSSSQMTVATTGSTVSSASTSLPSAGPPTPLIMIAAHALSALLLTPAPHTKDLDEIKREAGEWWASVGLFALRQLQQMQNQEDGAALSKAIEALGTDVASGDALALKAVYDLAAKKLLKLRFAGARRIVFFPANIV